MFNKASNIQEKDLKPYDLILRQDMYASTGGLFYICLLNKEGQLTDYPYSWCDLSNPNWKNEVKSQCSSVVFLNRANVWYIKVGSVK
ncbi:MAG: hypothetical protein AABY22_36640 [Nanoarchaeota archaeon]